VEPICAVAGHLLAKVSWTCHQSDSDIEITGFHILVNGKQYGSLLHEGVDCLRIKVDRHSLTLKYLFLCMLEAKMFQLLVYCK